MLEQAVCRSRRWLGRGGFLVILGTVGVIGGLAWNRHTAQVIVIPLAAPPAWEPAARVAPPAAATSAAPAPPVAPPVPAVAPPTVGRTCPTDVTAIGLPLTDPYGTADKMLRDAAASQTGCTIVARSEATLYVS